MHQKGREEPVVVAMQHLHGSKALTMLGPILLLTWHRLRPVQVGLVASSTHYDWTEVLDW